MSKQINLPHDDSSCGWYAALAQQPACKRLQGEQRADYAVIGASALDRDGDILDFDLAEVRVSKTIIRQSRKVFLVCDASKLDRSAPARLASLAEIDTLFTDRSLPPELARRCNDWGTKVTIVS